VGEKIFGGMDAEADGTTHIGFKLELEHADALVSSDPRFVRAKYVGHKGWVSMDVSAVSDWDEVRALVHESYRLIAPKRSYEKVGKTFAGATPAPPKKAPAKKTAASKPPSKKVATKSSAKTAVAQTAAKKRPAKKAPAALASASAAKFRSRRGS
jgi:predicted DNA-binding protein (MmcQ/YjbR family)